MVKSIWKKAKNRSLQNLKKAGSSLVRLHTVGKEISEPL